MKKAKGSKGKQNKQIAVKITPGGPHRIIYDFESQAWTILTPSIDQEAIDADIAAAMKENQRREAGQV